MINNRQAGRRRGRGGNGNGGNAPRQGGQGRGDNGNRIDSRARGNASQLYEKYKNMAADAQRQGDRVNTEYYLQFADHYFRVLSDQRGRFEEQPQRRQQFDDNDGDEDFGDEGEPIRAGEQAEAPRGDRQQRDGYREPRQQNDRQQGDRQQGDRQQGDRQANDRGGDRYNGDRQNGERSSNDRQNGERSSNDRQGADRHNGDRQERPRRWEREERVARPVEVETEIAGQHRADPIAPGEDLAARADTVIAADGPLGVEPAPRRRGRPRRDAAVAPTTETTAAESNGFEADRLPPSLGTTAANDADGDTDAPKPRRRRVRAAAAPDVVAD
ncbi:DUF4167 domain-containing protein [Sphingomonas sp. 1P08PE]|uniref:DUF4167 domain-containing protein n=1 Tax=Sphingomonas sp. 1P08PE TaxID=554122 RepID=UPI0039A2427C